LEEYLKWLKRLPPEERLRPRLQSGLAWLFEFESPRGVPRAMKRVPSDVGTCFDTRVCKAFYKGGYAILRMISGLKVAQNSGLK
jgi:hypothetical protein